MIVWKFSTPAKTEFEYSQDSRVCADGWLTSSVCVVFFASEKAPDKCFLEGTSERHLEFKRDIGGQVQGLSPATV